MSKKHTKGCGTLKPLHGKAGEVYGTVNVDGETLSVKSQVKKSEQTGLPYLSLSFNPMDDCTGEPIKS